MLHLYYLNILVLTFDIKSQKVFYNFIEQRKMKFEGNMNRFKRISGGCGDTGSAGSTGAQGAAGSGSAGWWGSTGCTGNAGPGGSTGSQGPTGWGGATVSQDGTGSTGSKKLKKYFSNVCKSCIYMTKCQ